MLRAFSTAATGMIAQQTMVDTIANNLANVNTTGFKRSQVNFKDLLYTQMLEPGAEVASGIKNPVGLEIGSGVRVDSTPKIFTNGEMENTNNKMDVAIQGSGFFEVTMPNGDLRYTRDGSFMINANGLLVTSGGHTISPGITIPSDANSIEIGRDGTVTAISSTGNSIVGTISLARFINPVGLKSEGSNLFSETEASGNAQTGAAGSAGYGTLMPGFLEKSNVQMVTELVNLIKAQRAYEINSRAIKAGDEMLRTANDIVR